MNNESIASQVFRLTGKVLGICIKCGLFILVVLSFINEYLTYAAFNGEGIPAYTRLNDFNSYMIALAVMFVSCFAYFSYGLIRRRGLLSLDILISLMIVSYIFINFEPWVSNIESTTAGYDSLLINIRVVFYAVFLSMTIVYLIVVSTLALYHFFFNVETVNVFNNEKAVEAKINSQKMQKLIEIQRRMAEVEDSHLSTQEYQTMVRQIYSDKLILHKSY